MLIFLILYCKWQARENALFSYLKFIPDGDSFTGWSEYLSISLPSTVLLCARIWAGQVLVFIAGYMSVTDQSSQIVINTISGFINMLARALQEVSCALIGNSIGANDVPLARRFFKHIGGTNLLLTVLISIVILIYRHSLTAIFSDDELVRKTGADVLILVAFTRIFDSMA